MASPSELRSQVAAFPQTSFPPPEGPTGPAFSAFDRAQVEVATELAVRFGEIAAGNGGIDGVADVLEAAGRETRRRSGSLVKYALLRDNRYPDQRSMGYPFERRLAGGASAALGALANAGQRTLTIRCKR